MSAKAKYTVEFATKTGRKVVRLYQTWYDMRKRCVAGCREARNYFDRGISVCKEWTDWPTFARWARANGYTDELTIDRIDNDGNYEPTNCRWVTKSENIRNRDPVRVSAASRARCLRANARPFFCVETGEVFLNQQEAVGQKGVHASCISQALSGKQKSAGGLHWSYLGG